MYKNNIYLIFYLNFLMKTTNKIKYIRK